MGETFEKHIKLDFPYKSQSTSKGKFKVFSGESTDGYWKPEDIRELDNKKLYS